MVLIRFIPPSTGKESQHEKELERARQLSHAAKISHARRKIKEIKNISASSTHYEWTLIFPDTKPLACPAAKKLPRPRLFEGCSDPFDALGTPITPEMNRVIAFTRDAYLPSVYIPNFIREDPEADPPSQKLIATKALGGSLGVWRDLALGFSSTEVFEAWICTHASALAASLTGEESLKFEKLALQYRARSIRNLRRAIQVKQQTRAAPTLSLILQIMYLFRAECIHDGRVGAQVHAVVLPWIEEAKMSEEHAINLLVVAIWSDTEMACKSMTKPFLDYKGWLSNRLRGFWDYTEPFMPPQAPSIEDELHKSIKLGDTVVKDAMIRMRRCLHLRAVKHPLRLHPPNDHFIGDLNYLWMATTTMHDIGLLIGHALNLVQSNDVASPQQALRAATTLAALYSVRKYLHEARFNGVDVRDAPLLMPEAQRVIGPFIDTLSQDDDNREVLFWICFTVVWHEQQVRRNSKMKNAGPFVTPTRFTGHLAALAEKLQLTEWVNARRLLERFVLSDIMRPHPETWYDPMIRYSAATKRLALAPVGDRDLPL